MPDDLPLTLAEAAGIVNQKVAEMRAFNRLKEAIDAALAAEHGLAVAQAAQAKAEADLASLTEKLNAYRVAAVVEAQRIKEDSEAEISAVRARATEAIAKINADRDAAIQEQKQARAAVDGDISAAKAELAQVRGQIDAAKAELSNVDAVKTSLEAKVKEIQASFAVFMPKA